VGAIQLQEQDLHQLLPCLPYSSARPLPYVGFPSVHPVQNSTHKDHPKKIPTINQLLSIIGTLTPE
jgi:hypothetical protein